MASTTPSIASRPSRGDVMRSLFPPPAWVPPQSSVPGSRQNEPADHRGHDLVRSAADSQDPTVAIVPLDLTLAHVPHATVELDRGVDNAIARSDRGVLGHGNPCQDIRARKPVVSQRPRIGAGNVHVPGHLRDAMPNDLATRQRAAERLPLPHPADGEIEAALRSGLRLYGDAQPLDGELRHDRKES